MRRWALLALACTLAVTAWVGWDPYTKLRPPTSAVVTAAGPADVAGVRYRVIDAQRLNRIDFADHDPLIPPSGAVWVRLRASLELIDPATPPDSLGCTGFLVAGHDEVGRRRRTGDRS